MSETSIPTLQQHVGITITAELLWALQTFIFKHAVKKGLRKKNNNRAIVKNILKDQIKT